MEVLSKEEWKIMDLFRKNILGEFTIPEVMKELGKSSYSWTFNSIKKLGSRGLLKSNRKGHSDIYRLNMESPLAISHISFLEELAARNAKLPYENIDILLKSIPLSYFSFIVAGSYACGKADKNSDIDMVVIIEDDLSAKKIMNALRNKGQIMIPEVHPYVFTRSEFLNMLLDNEENYGKMIFQNKLVLFGAQNYYSILNEAIKKGFRG